MSLYLTERSERFISAKFHTFFLLSHVLVSLFFIRFLSNKVS